MTRAELTRHPRWPLYRTLRRAIQRELEALAQGPVTEGMVDIYLHHRLGEITNRLKQLFRRDFEARTNALRETEPQH